MAEAPVQNLQPTFTGPILLFDGVCNLCTGTVRFVIGRDARKRFRFASLQSPVADQLLGPMADGNASVRRAT
ncbi:MAG: DUF393 domain-containing protein [Nitrospinae bacterium]|nr:DUF393 domain-containing protein [Nitrospinota bacterium]